MPKNASNNRVKSARRAKPDKLPSLSAFEAQIMSFVTNSIAFENYGHCCSVEDMAKQFKRTPGRFATTLKKLAEKGYLTIEGDVLPWVYRTIAALQRQDADLSDTEAKKILKKIRR